jgi:hypothetical protein
MESKICSGTFGKDFLFTPSGDVIIATSNCDFSTVNLSTGLVTTLISNSGGGPYCPFETHCMQWAPDSRLCLLVDNGLFNLWEHAILQYSEDGGQQDPLIPYNFPLHPDQLDLGSTVFCFGPDGNIYAPNSNHAINRFDGQSGQFIDRFIDGYLVPSEILQLIFTPDGKKLYVVVQRMVLEFDVSTKSRTNLFPIGTPTPTFCTWINSDWVEKQKAIEQQEIVDTLAQFIPARRPPSFRYRFPVPLYVVGEMFGLSSQVVVLKTMRDKRILGNDAETQALGRRLRDAVTRYALQSLTLMLSDREAAAKIDRAIVDMLGHTDEGELKALLRLLGESAAGSR